MIERIPYRSALVNQESFLRTHQKLRRFSIACWKLEKFWDGVLTTLIYILRFVHTYQDMFSEIGSYQTHLIHIAVLKIIWFDWGKVLIFLFWLDIIQLSLRHIQIVIWANLFVYCFRIAILMLLNENILVFLEIKVVIVYQILTQFTILWIIVQFLL